MKISTSQIRTSINDINTALQGAEAALQRIIHNQSDDDWEERNIEWFMESAFISTCILSEALELPLLREQIFKLYNDASLTGFGKCEPDIDGEPYLKWSSHLRKYLNGISSTFGISDSKTVTKDVEDILRNCVYSITNLKAFRTLPADEADVHNRIEVMLKPVFSDLKSKPSIQHTIKNFVPDTGLPSIRTLIEYKFVTDKNQVTPIADQILADTRGYSSPDWDNIIFVIYETSRLLQESEWNQLLQGCGITGNITAIVLCGSDPQLSQVVSANSKRRGRPKNTTKNADEADD